MNHPSDLFSRSVRLRKPHEDAEMGAFNIDAWFREWLMPAYGKPDLVCAEAIMGLTAQRSEDAARVAMAVHTGLWMACRRFHIRLERVAASTVRKHFIGVGMAPKGSDIKAMVAQRCVQLGYVDRSVRDRNRTDAVAVFDYAAATFARRRPAGVALLGGVA